MSNVLVNKTHVAIVLDKSGSMSPLRQAAVRDLNSQLESIKKNAAPGSGLEAYVSLIIFDHEVGVLFNSMKPEEIPLMTASQYAPSGNTALYDAIAKAIDIIQPKINNPTDAALLVVITDGEENSSSQHNRETVPARLKELEASEQWTITYLGTKHNVGDFIQTLGASAGNTCSGIESLGTGTTSSMHDRYFTARKGGVRKLKDSYL